MSDDTESRTGEEEQEETEQASGTHEGQEAEATGEDSDSSEGRSEEETESSAAADEEEEVKKEMERIEEDPPENLDDWPQGKAKYETYGGPEGEHGYHEGPEARLGPSSLRHHEGGDISIEGEKVDNPEEYKGEPVPGGPTDPNAPNRGGEREKEEEEEEDE